MEVKFIIPDVDPDAGFILTIDVGDDMPFLHFKLITFLRGVYAHGCLINKSKYRYYNGSSEKAVFMLLNEMMSDMDKFMYDNQVEIDAYVTDWYDRFATAEIKKQLNEL